jgi:hypothetical protein
MVVRYCVGVANRFKVLIKENHEYRRNLQPSYRKLQLKSHENGIRKSYCIFIKHSKIMVLILPMLINR